jgi:hypothetical protein
MGNGRHLGALDLATPDFSCVTCGDTIQFTEETYVVTIVIAHLTEKGMLYSPLIFEDGDFLWEPQFFCESCWDCSKEELADYKRDVPLVDDDQSITNCSTCHSGIRTGEVVGIITAGEVRQASRYPNGEYGGTTFKCTSPDPHVLCISCINMLNSDVVDELWDEPVKQYHECPEGTAIRCWRNGCPAEEDSNCANCAYTKTG